MKKLLRFTRNLLVLVGWSYLFTLVSNGLTSIIWKFDYLSPKSWQILNTFWNNGGIIKTTPDVLLLLVLFLLPFLWLTGFILALKQNFVSWAVYPFKKLADIFGSKEPDEPDRIVLKNLKSNTHLAEEIKAEIDSLKPEKTKEAGNIRTEIIKKRSIPAKK